MTNSPYDGTQNPASYPAPYNPQPPAPLQPYGTYGANQYIMNPYPPARPTSGMAIAGFVLSLVGIASCGIVSIVGLVLSVIGMKDTKDGTKEGRGMAIAGLVISVVGVVFTVLFVLFYFIGWFSMAALIGTSGGYAT